MTLHKHFLLLTLALFILAFVGCADDSTDDFIQADGDAEQEQQESSENEESEAEEETSTALLNLDAIEGSSPLFDFAQVENDIFKAPFPSDYLLDENGKMKLSGFPNPGDVQLLDDFTEYAENVMDGFGLNTPTYFTFEAELDVTSLPGDIAKTHSFDSSVLLLNIDPDSPEQGQLTPTFWHFVNEATDFEPAHLLSVSPVDGFPLRGATTYAMILTDGIKTKDGKAIGRSQSLADALSEKASDKLNNVYNPLAKWLSENTDKLALDKVRAATVFTTTNPIKELKALRDYVAAEYPDGKIKGELKDREFNKLQDGYLVFSGHYNAPNFQRGEAPYQTEGGGIFFNEDGTPIVQKDEELRFSISIPADATVPADGWPLVLYAHGTGGDYESYLGTRKNDESTRILASKIAVIGIDQPIHGPRGGGISGDALDLATFNYLNQESGRSIFRQGAMDTISLAYLVRAGKLTLSKNTCTSWPSDTEYTGKESISFNGDNLMFAGHSQGGMTGSLVAAVEDNIRGYVLSGAAGRMSITIMERESPDILGMVAPIIGAQKEDIHFNHPVLALVQLLTEITDMINYAPYWIEMPFNKKAKHVLMTTGFEDTMSPKKGAAALAMAGRLPQIKDKDNKVVERVAGMDLMSIPALDRPASDTVTGPDGNKASCGFLQYPDDGHFAIYRNDDAASMYQEFLRSLAYDDKPVFGYE